MCVCVCVLRPHTHTCVCACVCTFTHVCACCHICMYECAYVLIIVTIIYVIFVGPNKKIKYYKNILFSKYTECVHCD